MQVCAHTDIALTTAFFFVPTFVGSSSLLAVDTFINHCSGNLTRSWSVIAHCTPKIKKTALGFTTQVNPSSRKSTSGRHQLQPSSFGTPKSVFHGRKWCKTKNAIQNSLRFLDTRTAGRFCTRKEDDSHLTWNLWVGLSCPNLSM
jgi:hypothetical protein